jgi:hypothetical protein
MEQFVPLELSDAEISIIDHGNEAGQQNSTFMKIVSNIFQRRAI